MNIHFVIVFIILLILPKDIFAADNTIPILTFEQLEPRLHHNNDTVYIVNFWATWCIPCRKELPEFLKIEEKYKNDKIRLLLVSLDFVNQIENILKPFIAKNNITSEIVVLNSPDANKWIDKVDSLWSGSIPATIFYKNDTKIFYEGEINYSTIETQINKLLNLKNP
jgi:thiol-disulfide isomerase/thioredoxin